MKHEISALVGQLKLSHNLTHADIDSACYCFAIGANNLLDGIDPDDAGAVAVASDTKKLVELMEERDFGNVFKGVA